jgi:hypothetical protein
MVFSLVHCVSWVVFIVDGETLSLCILSGEVSCKIELCFHMHQKNLTAFFLMLLLPGCAMTTILSLEWDLESIGNVTSLQLRSCKLLLCSFY